MGGEAVSTANAGTDVRSASFVFGDGAVCGVGSLPHLDAPAAAEFATAEFGIPTIPSLPRRSPAEQPVARAVSGLPGVALGDSGRLSLDPARARVGGSVRTDLAHDAFAGVRAFLEHAERTGLNGRPVKWQFVGPVTLGVALHRAGLESDDAFALSVRAVRSHLVNLSSAITQVLPDSPQLLLLDEPALGDLMHPEFPIPPDAAIDAVSSGMAVLAPSTAIGVHCCTPCDIATLLATGPQVVSVPALPALVEWAGYVARFLDGGGIIAWGAVPTGGPLALSADRHWRSLSDLWCELVQRGCDPVALRRQSLITPACGLAMHTDAVATAVVRSAAEIGKRVGDQAGATRLALGA